MPDADKLHVATMRSQLGRVRGLGSARTGSAHWWAERWTSVALIPLTLWFVWSVFHLVGHPYASLLLWAHGPFHTVMLLALVLITFHHMALGLQVVIEDYVHAEPSKMISLLVMKGVTLLLALSCVVSVLKLSFLQAG